MQSITQDIEPPPTCGLQANFQKGGGSGFQDQITQSPSIANVVINIISAITFELGIYAGKKVIGSAWEKLKRKEFEKR